MPTKPLTLRLRPSRLNWTVMISVVTALIAVATVILHLIGVVRHQAYLGYWGVDSGLFPKTTDWLLINGYYGLVDRSGAVLIAVLGNFHWLLVAAIPLGAYVFILLSPIGAWTAARPRWLLARPEWCQQLLRHMVLTMLFVVAVPFVLLLLTIPMVIPAALGELAGKAAAEAAATEYKKGCDKSRYPCVQLKRNGEILATGFVLDDSPAQIAIFDIQLQRGHTLPRDGIELISSRLPGAKVGTTP